jgi:hypothetical protein
MRGGLLTLLALLGSSSVAWAQIQFLPTHRTETNVKVSADEVVARIMSFDQNNDGRVGVAELSERMRPLVSRGDRNGDETLDPGEVRAMALEPVTQTGRLFKTSGGYSFGDDVGLSSRVHIEGALEDLRLTSDKRERALPIVRAYVEQVENTARANLLSQLETLLSFEEFVTVTNLLDAQHHQITLRSSTAQGPRVFRMAAGLGNLTRRLDAMALGAPKNEQARAALEQYKSRIRLGSEDERAELMARLTDVLSEEELDNYNAALQRRPVVANSAAFTIALRDGVTAIRERSGVVPAVLIERLSLEGVITR